MINTNALTVGRWGSIYLNKSRNGGKEIAGLKRGGVDGLKWGEGRESTRLAEGARKKKSGGWKDGSVGNSSRVKHADQAVNVVVYLFAQLPPHCRWDCQSKPAGRHGYSFSKFGYERGVWSNPPCACISGEYERPATRSLSRLSSKTHLATKRTTYRSTKGFPKQVYLTSHRARLELRRRKAKLANLCLHQICTILAR